MKRKIFLTLTLLVLTFGLNICANAQKGQSFKGINWKKMAENARNGNAEVDKEMLAQIEEAYSEPKIEADDFFGANLTGTWYVTVPGPTPEETFYAYQTFGLDGTFVETSNLLVTLTEGPAHGVWERRIRGNVLTFELFAFDPENGVQVGRIRVRCYIQMINRNYFTAFSAVDFIELDGTVIPNIATGHFSGERVQVRGLG